MEHGEFRDPRLVTGYDVECPWSREDDFFLSVLAEEPAPRVLDLGCGTGRLTIAMAAAGHRVTGVDPAWPSLELARRKPGAEAVTWLEGSTGVLPEHAFDAAFMTSHVAQFFVADDEWAVALRDLRRALVPGGRLVFDSRDPADRRWETWNPVDSRHENALPDGTRYTTWVEVTSVVDGAVRFVHRYAFSDGDERAATATLRFRTEPELRSSLGEAGFAVERIYGGWNRDPVGHPDGEFLVVARAPSSRPRTSRPG
jgi:SAM-dependent methyltransferase